VSSSKTVYALLKNDLERGCVIPPVVLAIAEVPTSTEDKTKFIQSHSQSVIILDGLQRTFTILDLYTDLKTTGDTSGVETLEKHTIRVEIYIGINRLGILYRMLTLNTGQTPMSLRQQIEIMYLDYIGSDFDDGVELIRESDNARATRAEQYNFKDMVEGFNSYLERDELPIDRGTLLENIETLEKLSVENADSDLFKDFVDSWHKTSKTIIGLIGKHELSDEFLKTNTNPFGKNGTQLIKKPQAMSGFGAAVGKLRDFGLIEDFQSITQMADNLHMDDPISFLEETNGHLAWIRENSKKIGNAQRSLFQYFFRDLFNKESDTFTDIKASMSSAFRKYQSQNF
jgi:hypothetical protein